MHPSGSDSITFSELCPFTKRQHSFTFTAYELLSAARMETIITTIRYSASLESGLCESRSRALTEMIFKIIAWEKGLAPHHPLLPKSGPYQEKKKSKTSSPPEEEKKEEKK